MPNYTTNYNLKKPLDSEQFTVDDANGNMDIIDTTLLSKVDKVSGKSLVSDADITDLTDGNETTLHKHSASNITNTPTGNLSSTNVQTALAELDTEKAPTSHTHDDRYYTETEVNNLLNATNIANTPSGNISSTNVQGAINELDNEKAGKLFATNLVTNGDFSNGTTGWTNSFSSLSVASNTATVTGNGGASSARLEQAESVTNGIKYYLRARARVTNSLATSISLRLWNAVSAQEVQAQSTPLINQFYNLSGVITSTNTSAVGAVWVTSFYVDATTQNGKVMEVQYVSMINLTAIFGAGKEPTKEQVDWLLAQKYTNSWFNGTAELTSILDLLTLVNTKANITQEAWITPTLLNGWLAFDAPSTPKYRKDTIGKVNISGRIKSGTNNTDAFLLPVGYRPLHNLNIPIVSNGVFARIVIQTTGYVFIATTDNTNVAIDNISFFTDI